MDIIVLAGGISTERTVSISSGEQVCMALRRKGHRAVLLDVYYGTEQNADQDFFAGGDYDVAAAAEAMRTQTPLLAKEGRRRCFFGSHVLELCQLADIVFLALHGENGENGKVQAAFELMGIPYTGTDHISSAICMDKGISRSLLTAGGVPMAKGICLKKNEAAGAQGLLAEAGIGYPCIVKPCCGGSSIGVAIAQDAEGFEKALVEAFSYEEEIVIESYINGREFSVALIEGRPLPVIEIAPKQGFYDYKNKYQAGSTVETCPADLSAEQTQTMQDYAKLAWSILHLHTYARIDFMMDSTGAMYCLEANTLPGMTPTSLIPQEAAAIGMSYEELCETIIEISVKKDMSGL